MASVPVPSQALDKTINQESESSDQNKNSGMKLSRSIQASGSSTSIENPEINKPSTKFYIKLRKSENSVESRALEDKSKLKTSPNNDMVKDEYVGNFNIGDFVDEPKTWNLRPRKPKVKPSNEGKQVEAPTADQAVQVTKKKPKKFKLSTVLTKKEIEKDYIALTGRKPSKRPKKRPISVQENIDKIFPGLGLPSSINARTYERYYVQDPDSDTDQD